MCAASEMQPELMALPTFQTAAGMETERRPTYGHNGTCTPMEADQATAVLHSWCTGAGEAAIQAPRQVTQYSIHILPPSPNAKCAASSSQLSMAHVGISLGSSKGAGFLHCQLLRLPPAPIAPPD
jgi:hypothetical protein